MTICRTYCKSGIFYVYYFPVKTITPGESVRNKADRSTFKGYFTYKCSQVTI